jgi:O-antigen ligase
VVTNLRGYFESWWRELPQAPAARWASLFFTGHILTLLISVAASQAFLAAATVAYLIHWLGPRPVPRAVSFPPVKLPLLLFCLATFNSILWAEYPVLGWAALRKLVLFVIMLLTVNLVASARHLRALFQGLFLVSAMTGLVAIGQFFVQYRGQRLSHPGHVYYFMTLTRIHGFMGHWMNFGGQQMLVFPALLAFLLLASSPSRPYSSPLSRGERGEGEGSRGEGSIPALNASQVNAAHPSRAKVLYWLVMAIVLTSIVLNLTRGAWLGCAVAAVYIVARWKPRTLWVIPFLLVGAFLAAPSMIRRRVSLTLHPTNDPALAIRLEMWNVGLKMIREHPWVGVGPGNIPLLYTKYLPSGATPMAGYHDHLHDNFLQIAAERGLPCLLAWLWFMLGLGWHILRIRRGLLSERWVADAAFAGWLAFLAEGFFEFNFGASPVLMVFLFVTSTPFVAEQIESCVPEAVSHL